MPSHRCRECGEWMSDTARTCRFCGAADGAVIPDGRGAARQEALGGAGRRSPWAGWLVGCPRAGGGVRPRLVRSSAPFDVADRRARGDSSPEARDVRRFDSVAQRWPIGTTHGPPDRCQTYHPLRRPGRIGRNGARLRRTWTELRDTLARRHPMALFLDRSQPRRNLLGFAAQEWVSATAADARRGVALGAFGVRNRRPMRPSVPFCKQPAGTDMVRH